MSSPIRQVTIAELYRRCPAVADFFAAHGILTAPEMRVTLDAIVRQHLQTAASSTTGDAAESNSDELMSTSKRIDFFESLEAFMTQMTALQRDVIASIDTVTVLPGKNKLGETEAAGITLRTGEITAVVGPTGAGKSRLLEDLECLAQNDTPTGRQILVNGEIPQEEMRFSAEGVVAQLSQNMNFVMDLSVVDFITMHAESRMVANVPRIVEQIFVTANDLSGETFTRETAVTQLSGGQSRALMIADTALLSAAPIILIDEIENAGVDKIKALDLLVSSNKIVLLSTHDPLLALSAHRRVVIRNGGIYKILATTDGERANVATLQQLDRVVSDIRWRLRSGEEILSVPEFN